MGRDIVEVTIDTVEADPQPRCPRHPLCGYLKRVRTVVNGIPSDAVLTCASCFDELPQEGPFTVSTMTEPGVPLQTGPRPPSRATKRRSRRQEDSVAADLGGRRQKASGALPGQKGDVRAKGRARVECKMTTTRSYRVTREELEKIRGEAVYPEVPVLVVSFIDPATKKERDRWAVVPWTWAVEFLKNPD